ncbi:MAG TPA: PDZ domain-containing protein, partial [Kofleriaceae bacterium]
WRTKAPIAGAACHAVLAADGLHGVTNWDWRVAPRSDARGRVLLDPAPAGTVGVWCVMPSNRMSIPSTEVTLKPGGHASVQLASVELTSGWPSTIGIEFDLRRITARIVRVLPDSPALAAGLVAGDVVVSVDGASIAGLNPNGVLHLIDSHDIGSSVTLGITRGATAKAVTMTTKPRRYL